MPAVRGCSGEAGADVGFVERPVVAQSAAERRTAYRLRHDLPFYARHCLKVVDERGETVPFEFRKAQLKLDRALEAQRRAGRPMRAIVLKSRKVGISTAVQAKVFHETTLEANCRSLIVAQDTDTAGELFEISDRFYAHLPDDPEFKPALTSRRNSPGGMKQLAFGEPSRAKRARGDLGVNSLLKIDTAQTVNAGRGKTIGKLHCTEVAFWDQGVSKRYSSAGKKKALSLLNAVPDQPGTLVVLESTANGANWFKARWDRAERGEGGYAAVFIGWTEDENCWREFDDPDHRERFMEEIGAGEYGEDEPWLIERFGCVPEQLLWRRTAIVDKCDGDLITFRQEYPSVPMEAFVGSGKQFFAFKHVAAAEDEARQFDPPREDAAIEDPLRQPGDGLLVAAGFKQRKLLTGTEEVPTGALWLPAGAAQAESGKDLWRVWAHPEEWTRMERRQGAEFEVTGPRPYVVFVDVAAGDEQTSSGEPDYHAIQVIDHATREQVAQFRSRTDRDELALEAFMVGLYFNEALIAVETTGGLGLTVVETLYKRLGYRKLYRRRKLGGTSERPQSVLGWDTSRATKPAMEDTASALLREGSHGIRSLDLVAEFKTYVRFENGQRGADEDAFDDLLMAWMGAQRVAEVIPPRITRPERRHHWNSIMRPGVGGR